MKLNEGTLWLMFVPNGAERRALSPGSCVCQVPVPPHIPRNFTDDGALILSPETDAYDTLMTARLREAWINLEVEVEKGPPRERN